MADKELIDKLEPFLGVNGDSEALACLIERYYLPRPLYEDGEPVQFGDDAEVGQHLACMTYCVSQGMVCQLKFANNGDCPTLLNVRRGERVKRPVQDTREKVLEDLNGKYPYMPEREELIERIDALVNEGRWL